MSNSDINEIRSIAAQIVQRAAQDTNFLEQLKNSPEETLLEAGLPESAIAGFIKEVGLTPEVGGYILEELDGVCLATTQKIGLH